MAKVYVFLANGFEDVEALIPVDVLRRGGVEVVTVSTSDDLIVESAHGVGICADIMFEQGDFTDADLLMLPGGMPGAADKGYLYSRPRYRRWSDHYCRRSCSRFPLCLRVTLSVS